MFYNFTVFNEVMDSYVIDLNYIFEMFAVEIHFRNHFYWIELS